MRLISQLVVVIVSFVDLATFEYVDYKNLDAFNKEKCGQEKFMDWHKETKGFPCKTRRRYHDDNKHHDWPNRRSRPPKRMSFGYPIEYEEFPYHAQVFWVNTMNGDNWHCQAAIVHEDLLITAGHCVKEPPHWSGRVVLATITKNNLDGHGASVRIKSACVLKGYILEGYNSWNDLALIRLAKPIKYNEILQPICLDFTRPHLANTTCVSAGLEHRNGDYTNLKAMPYKLMKNDTDCRLDRSYYIGAHPTWAGNVCPGDSGSSMVCFDNCPEDGTRSYSVGVVIDVPPNSCRRGRASPIQVFDYYKMRDQVEQLFEDCLNDNNDTKNGTTIYEFHNSKPTLGNHEVTRHKIGED